MAKKIWKGGEIVGQVTAKVERNWNTTLMSRLISLWIRKNRRWTGRMIFMKIMVMKCG
jgi:hypothetical protein